MRTIRFLLKKEFRQIFRDATMLRMLVIVPLVQLLVLSSAATFEVREGRLWIVDQDRSAVSRGLLSRLEGSDRFVLAGRSATMAEAQGVLLDRRAGAIVHIPRDFARDLVRDGSAPLQLVFDAEDGAAAGIIQAYLTRIVHRYATELGREIGLRSGAAPPGAGGLEVRHRGWYNPGLDYYHYMVPGILVILVTIIGMSITAMNIVREKEIGTLEQLSVTPVTRTQFIAGKLLPFLLIALFDLALGLVVARWLFGIPMDGSLWLIGVSALAYLLVALGIGLWISTVVDTQQQAIFIAFTVNMIYLLMSGLFTPFTSMPEWAQWLGQLSPVKHFVRIMRDVLVRGAGAEAVAMPLLILTVYGLVVLGLSVRQFTKTTA